MGHPEWADHPDYATDAGRVRHRVALIAQIEGITATEPRRHWLSVLDERDIPCGPINTYDEVMSDAQIQARQMVVDTDHPTLGRIRTLGTPLKMSATPLETGRRAPLIGEHTAEVLREAGFTSRRDRRARSRRRRGTPRDEGE